MARAVVVGGGPAGLSAAIGLRRRGFDVTLFEQRGRWQGRVCGGFLNREAVRHLEWLGVLDTVRKEGVSVRQTILTIGSSSRAIELDHQDEMGLPRQRLEEILLDRARDEGADIRIGERFQQNPGDTQMAVFASGRGLVRRSSPTANEAGWYGWNASFENVDQHPGDMSLHFYAGGYVGTLTHADGQTNICGLVKRNPGETIPWETVFETALQRSPVFRDRMKHARRISDWHGVGPLPFGIRERAFFAVGDAAAVGEPFMGEGIGRALSAGPMLYDSAADADKFLSMWDAAYAGRFRLGAQLRRLLFDHPIFFAIFGKSLSATTLDHAISTTLWRKINEYGYHAKNLSHSKFGEVLPV